MMREKEGKRSKMISQENHVDRGETKIFNHNQMKANFFSSKRRKNVCSTWACLFLLSANANDPKLIMDH